MEEKSELPEPSEKFSKEEIEKLKDAVSLLPDDPLERRKALQSIGELSKASPGLVALSIHSEEILNAVDRTEMWRRVRERTSEGLGWTAKLIKDLAIILMALGIASSFLLWAAQGFPGVEVQPIESLDQQGKN